MPIRSSIRRRPIRGLDRALNSTDKQLLRNMENIYSRDNLGLNSKSVTTTASLEVSDANVLVTTSGSSYTVTLPYANSWGASKTPIIFIRHTSGTNNVTIAAQSGDTINGNSSITLYPSTSIQLTTDGSTKWFIVSEGGLTTYTYQIFTSTGTFTWPDGVSVCEVLVQAGGGGGAGTAATNEAGGGGGGGECLYWLPIYKTGSTISVTIGATASGGAAGAAGSNGNISAFGNIYAFGGIGGAVGTLTVGGNGGNGGFSGATGGAGGVGGNGGAAGQGGTGTTLGVRVGGGGGGGGGDNGTANGLSGAPSNFLILDIRATQNSGGGCGGSTVLYLGQAGGAAGASPGAANVSNTGAGGGGAGRQANNSGGDGASGLVIVRY